MNYIQILAFVVAFGCGGHVASAYADDLTDPAVIQDMLADFGEDVELLGLADVDQSSCGDVGLTPGLATADFDGDGHLDYAVILKFMDRQHLVEWESKTYNVIEFRLVVFLAREGGKLEAVELETLQDFIPAGMWIKLLPPGTVIQRGGESPLSIRVPAVKLHYCEKSSFVTWWENRSFSRYWTSD